MNKEKHRYDDIKIRKCSNDLQNKMRELDKAVGELLVVGASHWIEYRDIMKCNSSLNWTIQKIKEDTAALEYRIEMNEFKSNGELS